MKKIYVMFWIVIVGVCGVYLLILTNEKNELKEDSLVSEYAGSILDEVEIDNLDCDRLISMTGLTFDEKAVFFENNEQFIAELTNEELVDFSECVPLEIVRMLGSLTFKYREGDIVYAYSTEYETVLFKKDEDIWLIEISD